jgi:hypothetical protein
VRMDRSSALASYKSKDGPNYFLDPSLLCGRDGVERVAVDEGERWREGLVGDTGGV